MKERIKKSMQASQAVGREQECREDKQKRKVQFKLKLHIGKPFSSTGTVCSRETYWNTVISLIAIPLSHKVITN